MRMKLSDRRPVRLAPNRGLFTMKTKSERREWRKKRIRKKIQGTSERPRLSVFRSTMHIYAQVIDDNNKETIFATSTLSKDLKSQEKSSKTEMAKRVGVLVAESLKQKNISKVVFDRNGFVYHGRIKALAEGAREAGLEF
jgi:large subunit ribosomal protein L18